nr:glycosyltransferase family A protein [Angustibacter aerolatus]
MTLADAEPAFAGRAGVGARDAARRLVTEPAGEPLAAVVVPIYGVVDHLGECLTSLARQTVAERLQVVLVDDGSVDGSAQVAASFADGRPGWSLVRQPNAGPGPGAARNRGLRDVRAPYVLFCDGDDVLEPGAMEALVAAATRTGADVVVAAARQIPRPRTWRWTHLFEPLDGTVLTGDITDFPDLVHHPAPGDKALPGAGSCTSAGCASVRASTTRTRWSRCPRCWGRRGWRCCARWRRATGGGGRHLDHGQPLPARAEHLGPPAGGRAARDAASHAAARARRAAGRVPRPRLPGLPGTGLGAAGRGGAALLTRARAVYASVDPELVVDLTDGPVHALPYRAVLADDLAGLRDPAGSATGLDLSEPDAVRLRVQVDPPWDRALSLGRLRATADAVVVDGADLVLRGTVRLAGAPALHLLGAPVSVRLRGAGRTVPAVLSPAAGAEALQTCRFEARVPLAEPAAGHRGPPRRRDRRRAPAQRPDGAGRGCRAPRHRTGRARGAQRRRRRGRRPGEHRAAPAAPARPVGAAARPGPVAAPPRLSPRAPGSGRTSDPAQHRADGVLQAAAERSGERSRLVRREPASVVEGRAERPGQGRRARLGDPQALDPGPAHAVERVRHRRDPGHRQARAAGGSGAGCA